MSPMHHYLYDKTNIIPSKTDGFTVFNVNVSLATKRPESDVISYSGMFGCIRLAQHISLKITSKRCFHFIGSVYY